MRTYKLNNTILNVGNPEEIDLILFEKGYNNNGQVEYWIKIFYKDYSTPCFLGNIEETAKIIYNQIVDEVFSDVKVLAK